MTQPVLQTMNLSKRYGSLLAVDDLNLEIHEGEVFGFLGPNGAGKTTSINMMCGLLKPDQGKVLIKGKAIVNGSAKIRNTIGVCPQEIVLWSHLTCMEQLIFIGRMYNIRRQEIIQRGEQLLLSLGLIEKRNTLAHKLSGGMQRRLNLAMALVHNPDICILDEPEAGLDPQSRVAVRNYIKQLARQKTVILTTHNMDEAERLADRVAIIDHGQLLVLDTPQALKHSVGEGDVLEICLNGKPEEHQKALGILENLDSHIDVQLINDTLNIRALDVVNLMPDILSRLKTLDIPLSEVRIRENSLEDVFIQLTGRRLRA